MTFFTASFETVILRFGLMMAAVIIPFSVGYPIFALLALPLFLSAMTAVSFNNKVQKATIVPILQRDTKNNAA